MTPLSSVILLNKNLMAMKFSALFSIRIPYSIVILLSLMDTRNEYFVRLISQSDLSFSILGIDISA